ncbi:hypothetical protein KQH40_01015 [bacterium]|nr:hypothetical protein [bacterium]
MRELLTHLPSVSERYQPRPSKGARMERGYKTESGMLNGLLLASAALC